MRQADPMVAHFLSLGLIEQEDVALVAGLLAQARGVDGVPYDERELLGIAQALGRASERVAAAAADVIVRHLADLPEADRETTLLRWTQATVPPTSSAFAVLLGHRLRRVAQRRLAATRDAHVTSPPLTVGFVDLRGSTAFMMQRTPEEIASLTDDLYAVAQTVATTHEVAAGKFLGDGVLLVSADPDRLLHATADAVRELGRRTPLRAGAGIAHGLVIRRAGDWHGIPVNIAARLAELAGADEILLDADATSAHTVIDAWRDVTPRGLTEPRRVGVVLPG